MPDFAVNKPGKKLSKGFTPRRSEKKTAERQVLESGKAGKLPPSQGRPTAALEGLLKDFQGGVRALSGLLGQKPQEAKKAQIEHDVKVVHVPSHTHSEKSTTKYLVTGKPTVNPVAAGVHQRLAKEKMESHKLRDKSFDASVSSAIEERNIRVPSSSAIEERNIRVPSPVSVTTAAAPARRRRRAFPVITGADREAYKQVFEAHKGDSPHHTPSAARLAQLLRADVLIKSGAGQPNAQIHSMAQAVREGRRREVADMDPERVQRILYEALGGPHKAQQLLNSPSINRMIERHNTLIRAVHTQREQNERTREVLSPASTALRARFKAERSERPSGSFAEAAAPKAPEQGFARSWASTPITDEKHHEAELLDMLANNEAQHITQMSGGDSESDEKPLVGVATEMAKSSRANDRVMAGGGGGSSSTRSSPMSFGGGQASTPPVLPFAGGSAPRGNAPQAVASAVSGSSGGGGGGGKKGQQKLNGTLKIMNPNGQPGGEAQINGILS